MKSAVTLCAQMGSNGHQIASGVAETLGWKLVHRDLVNQAALRAGAPEIALAEIDEFGFFRLRLRSDVRRAYLRELESLAREMAHQGRVVFLCSAGPMLLRQTPGVLHVRIFASDEQRIQSLIAREPISVQAAAARLMVSDQVRARSMKRDYGTDWSDCESFHLIIHSGRWSIPAAIALIVQAVNLGD